MRPNPLTLMTPTLVAAFVISSTLIFGTGASGTESDTRREGDRASIVELFKQRVATFNGRDLSAQLELVDDNVSLITAVGQWTVHGKEEYGALMLHIWNRAFKNAILSEEVESIEFVRDDVAVVQLKLGFTPAENFPYDNITALRVVVKKDDKWLWRSSAHVPQRRDSPVTDEIFKASIDRNRAAVREILAETKKE